jgi:hypothetical protein
MRVTALGLAMAVPLVACRPSAPSSPTALRGQPKVAVLPFHPAGAAGVPDDAGAALARILAGHLAGDGVAVVDPDVVLGAAELADTGAWDARAAARVASKVGANVAVLGTLVRWQDRVGTAWAIEKPASLAYQATLVNGTDASTIRDDRFDYTQTTLSSNLLDLPRFLRSGGRWLTVQELADGALAQTAGRFVAALGVTTHAGAGDAGRTH